MGESMGLFVRPGFRRPADRRRRAARVDSRPRTVAAGNRLTFAAGLAIPFVLLAVTASAFNVGPDPGRALQEGIGCFRVSAVSAIPALIAAAFLAARALPTRPAVAGALYGLGCGLVADAGLRLFCRTPCLHTWCSGTAARLSARWPSVRSSRSPLRPGSPETATRPQRSTDPSAHLCSSIDAVSRSVIHPSPTAPLHPLRVSLFCKWRGLPPW